MTPLLRPIALLNRFRFLLFKHRVIINFILTFIILSSYLFFTFTQKGERIFEELLDSGRWYYICPLAIFMTLSLVFSAFTPTFKFLRETGQYLFIHNLDDFKNASRSLDIFVWTKFRTHIRSPYFCICLLGAYHFFGIQIPDLFFIPLTIYVFIVIGSQIWDMINFCFRFNEIAFNFFTYKSQRILRQLRLSLFLFMKRNKLPSNDPFSLRKHEWNWREKAIIWFEEFGKEDTTKVKMESDYLELIWQTLRLKSSFENDIKLAKNQNLNKFFFLLFLSKFAWFFTLISIITGFLLKILYDGNQLTFNSHNTEYGYFDMVYFWFTSLNTIGYGDMSIQRNSFISYLVALFIVTSPLVLVTLVLFLYSSLISTNTSFYTEKAINSINSESEEFYSEILGYFTEVTKNANEKELEQINELASQLSKK